MNAATPTAYDELRYRSEPNAAAHPAKLAAIGGLHGLHPRIGRGERVLEIGCGDGGHVLALADLCQDVQFVGCDLAPTAIELACERARRAGLENVRFVVADVRALPVGLGNFDCVIAHGLYSWIPEDARDALLAACAALLADEGIAFVSYNVRPGAHLRQMVRDVLLFHVAGIEDTATRLTEARALAQLLTRDGDREDAENATLRYEMRQLLARPDQALRHDDLAEHNFAPTFFEFVTHAQSLGLSFLAEAEYFTDGDLGLSPSTRGVLAGMERLAREQYRDFLACRRFRQTLLCRADRKVLERADPAAVDGLHVAAAHVGAAIAPPAGDAEVAPLERRIRALVAALHAAAPESLPFEAVRGAFGTDAPLNDLRTALVDGLRTGRLQLSTVPSRARREVSAQPRAGAHARQQARDGGLVPTADLRMVRLDDAQARALFVHLDGTRRAADLVRLLAAEGHAVTPAWVAEGLARFAKLGLLLG